MTHTLDLNDHVFTCPDCAFRAVVTTDGRVMLTRGGDAGHDHIGQARAQLAAIHAETERACTHLRSQLEQNRIKLGQYQILVRYVIAEYAPV